MLKLSGTVAAGTLLAACAPAVAPAPQVVKETVVVPQTVPPVTVKETVIVPQTVMAPAATGVPAPAAKPAPVTLEVLNPIGIISVTKEAAPRVQDLHGKKVCLIWETGMWRGEEILPLVGAMLKQRVPDVTIIPWTEFPSPTSPDKDTLALIKAKGCDFAIVGNGG
jgi:hypothetical protein